NTSGFQQFYAIGRIYSAWARAKMGETDGVVGRIREGLTELNPQRFHIAQGNYMTRLGEALAIIGAVAEALATVEEALLINPEVLAYRPNLFRLRGELRLKNTFDEAMAELAEKDFRDAIELSRRMRAKSLELRATTSLARLLGDTARRDEARAMLTEIYNWFTEGFDTADLKEAKALLDELDS